MTEEEKTRLISEKARVSSALAGIDVAGLGLDSTDPRLSEYISEVCSRPEAHNLWEQLGVERFVNLFHKYEFDSRAVRRFFYFYEQLYFPGKKGMQQFRLTPVQCFQFASVFGFRLSDGRRLVKECVLYVPRKFSKTTGTAAFAVWDLLCGDSNAEVYIGANSQLQAKKCFDVIRAALLKIDTQGRRFVINEQEIKPTRRNPRKAFAQCLTANARTKDGLNASTVIMDEFSQARDSALLTVLTTSMGVRAEPLTVIITTASDVFEGPFYSMLQGYKKLLLGEYEDDTAFCHLFEPDIGDKEDDPATWRKVHPHIGVTVTEEFYRQELARSRRNGAEAMMAFRTKLLNVYTENETKSWISGTFIRDHSADIDIRRMKRMPATVAIDLSVRGDFSVVTFGFYDEDDYHFYYHSKYFFPEGGLPGHQNEQLYRAWGNAGHLRIQEGAEVVDTDEIAEYILELEKYCDIVAICFDPYKSKDLVNILLASEVGATVRPFNQTQGHFTSPVQSFEMAIRTGHVTVDSNPINAWCFSNAVLDTDRNGNMKPYKRTDEGKIDSVITTLMCQGAFEESVRFE